MSNIKLVECQGTLPWDVNSDEKLLTFIGQMNLPVFGIKISFLDFKQVRNGWGGTTLIYNFEIAGEEAVRLEWLEELLAGILRADGTIKRFTCKDIEAPQDFRWDGKRLIPL